MQTYEYIQQVLVTSATPEDKAKCLALEINWLSDKLEQNKLSLQEAKAEADKAWSVYKDLRGDFLQGKGKLADLKLAYMMAINWDSCVVRYMEEVEYIENEIRKTQEKLGDLLDNLEVDWLLS